MLRLAANLLPVSLPPAFSASLAENIDITSGRPRRTLAPPMRRLTVCEARTHHGRHRTVGLVASLGGEQPDAARETLTQYWLLGSSNWCGGQIAGWSANPSGGGLREALHLPMGVRFPIMAADSSICKHARGCSRTLMRIHVLAERSPDHATQSRRAIQHPAKPQTIQRNNGCISVRTLDTLI